jgi:uncharacterized phage protein gp47/JayE
VSSAFDPDAATGSALDTLAAITGTVRNPPLKSAATLTATGTPGTVLPAGRVVSVAGTGVRFATTEEATIGGGGTVAVPAESEEYGPWPAAAGTLTVIETPVGGWASVTNALDATPGADVETDAALRLRRDAELASGGKGTVDALRAEVLRVDGVVACTVFENVTDATDADGVPPHAVEVMVQGGDDDAVRAAIWAAKPAGIATHGDEDGPVVDDEGTEHTVAFSRPVEVPIYVALSLHVEDDYPVDGDAQVEAEVVGLGDTYAAGQNVAASRLGARAFAVSGVAHLVSAYVGTAPGPGASVVAIGPRQIPVFDTSRVDVTTAAWSP